MTGRRYNQRAGFSLVELMVVITIIVVLIGLLLPAVWRAIVAANQAKAANDIRQLESAIQSFQSRFGVSYVPSRIKLCKWVVDYGTTQLDIDSKNYLTTLFPKLTTGSGQTSAPSVYGAWATNSSGANYSSTVPGGVNWTQDVAFTGVASYPVSGGGPSVILEGHQCLVFFLGGIQTETSQAFNGVTSTIFGCSGFSTNQLDPSDTTSTVARIPPFFEFTNNRLVQFIPGHPFFSYKDSVGANPQPYAYFSAYKQTNGYSRYAQGNLIPDNLHLVTSSPPKLWYYLNNTGTVLLPVLTPTLSSPVPPNPPNPPNPCIQPYATNIAVNTTTGSVTSWTFYKPDTFQILCAGRDSKWGLPPVDPVGNSAGNITTAYQAAGLTYSIPPGLTTPFPSGSGWANFANGPVPYGLWLPNGNNCTDDGKDDLSSFTPSTMQGGQ
jgi:prepilin-type N-terminal cleavage/methylation domain-containing protein